ncbi:LOW QUALITY PROTEIN: transcription factor Adf-1 [Drosophila gunungcola]|uniref:LOW QUALITY PROTEIN: transcription factor Adf-1 n=1 Tax=Drosophila gunungcola TaxID=103775 RepID=UPI0022E10D89|nr:LOW QUALITY PROTEIN: transcription factor Adf-1 [Drosophila gunungcola]
MNSFDYRLIKSVKHHNCIYKKGQSPILSRPEREQAWIAVARFCQKPIRQCQIRWKTLRDRYVREIKRPTSANGIVHLSEQLHFLRDHIRPRRRKHRNKTTYETDESNPEDDSLLKGKHEECKLYTKGTITSHETVENNLEEDSSLRANLIEQVKQELLIEDDEVKQEELLLECETEVDFLLDSSSAEFLEQESIDNEMPKERPTKSRNNSNSQGDLNQAQSKFLRVMNLIENALKEQPAEPQDHFYKYLESILSGVAESFRRDIQLKVLNLVNEEVKRAGYT